MIVWTATGQTDQLDELECYHCMNEPITATDLGSHVPCTCSFGTVILTERGLLTHIISKAQPLRNLAC